MLPALNEIRMTFVSASFLIASSETCRFASTIEPSSRQGRRCSAKRRQREGRRREGELTSNELVPVTTKERLDDVEHSGELNTKAKVDEPGSEKYLKVWTSYTRLREDCTRTASDK